MKYDVHLISDAQEDLFELYLYVANTDTPEKAERLIRKIEKTCAKLESISIRGYIPPELQAIGVNQYLQIHYKSYRIIYEIRNSKVFVHCIIDGRRDLRELLHNRLLR